MRIRRGIPAMATALLLGAAGLPEATAQVALGPDAEAPEPASPVAGPPGGGAEAWPFAVGERLEYDLYVRRFRAGRCVLEVEAAEVVRGVPVYRVSLTVDAGALFFRIDDRKVSWIAPDPFRSLRFAETSGDGSEVHRVVELNHEDRVFRERPADERGGEEPAGGARPETPRALLPEGAVDELAFLYLLRLLPLEPGTRLEMDRYFDPYRNPLRLTVGGRTEVKTSGGEFRTLVLHPVLPASDAFSAKARAEILLSDDDRRIVVQMRSRTSLGPVTARLRSYEPGS